MKEFYQNLMQIIRTTDAPVYKHGSEIHTYAEMHEQMQKINSVLKSYKQKCIAHYTSKKFDAYSAIYATLLSENTWVPLNPDFPVDRSLSMLEQSKPSVIFTNCELPEILARYAREHEIKVCDLAEVVASNSPTPFVTGNFAKNDIAYIMFTSGSTGKPKGVPMTHENYINFVRNAMTLLPFVKGDVFADFHDFGFDISVFYLFCCPLAHGAFAPIINTADKIIPLKHINENGITVWSSVPSVIVRIKALHAQKKLTTPVRIMFLCGEPFRLDVLDYCLNNMQLKHVYNFYGLTETGVENFYHPCEARDIENFKSHGFVPIGKPLPGNDVKISDEGELLLSGCQVTPGYLGGIGKERFTMIDGKCWYHSGDIVQIHDGYYFCKGRMDSQVKLSGYRVELMDIEAHLRMLPAISEAVCFVHESGIQKQLIAAVSAQHKVDASALQSELAKTLPSYMIPKRIVQLDEVPLNSNGKIDRKKVAQWYHDNY